MRVKGPLPKHVVAQKISPTSGSKPEDRGEKSLTRLRLELGRLSEIRAHQSLSTPAISPNQER